MDLKSHISRIYQRQSELHTNRKTKSGKPRQDLIGYENEDLMLSDYMVWFNNTYIQSNPELVQCVFHIENEGNFGGEYGAIQGAISKGKGKKKGILDLESVYLGLMSWGEMKTNEGVFGDKQLEFIRHLTDNGIDVFIFKNNFDFFKFWIQEIVIKRISLGGGCWNNIEQVKNRLKAMQ